MLPIFKYKCYQSFEKNYSFLSSCVRNDENEFNTPKVFYEVKGVK